LIAFIIPSSSSVTSPEVSVLILSKAPGMKKTSVRTPVRDSHVLLVESQQPVIPACFWRGSSPLKDSGWLVVARRLSRGTIKAQAKSVPLLDRIPWRNRGVLNLSLWREKRQFFRDFSADTNPWEPLVHVFRIMTGHGDSRIILSKKLRVSHPPSPDLAP
jgi:hypothetical protein